MNCRRCGTLNTEVENYCSNCGFPLPEPRTPLTRQAQPPLTVSKAPRRKGLQWTRRRLVAVVLFVLIVGTLGGLNERHKDAQRSRAGSSITPYVANSSLLQVIDPTISNFVDSTVAPTPTTGKVEIIRTGNFTIDQVHAIEAPRFDNVIHLDPLDDGRYWLIVVFHIRNVSSSRQSIKSGDVTLFADGNEIGSAGNETIVVSKAIDQQIMGSLIGAGMASGDDQTLVQVFKVNPSAQVLQLKFDLDTASYLNLGAYLAESNGDPAEILPLPTPTPTITSTPLPTDTPRPPTFTPTAKPTSTPKSYGGTSRSGWVYNVKSADVILDGYWTVGNLTFTPNGKFVIIQVGVTNLTGDAAAPTDAMNGFFVINKRKGSERWTYSPNPSLATTAYFAGVDPSAKIANGSTITISIVFDIPHQFDSYDLNLRNSHSDDLDVNLADPIKNGTLGFH